MPETIYEQPDNSPIAALLSRIGDSLFGDHSEEERRRRQNAANVGPPNNAATSGTNALPNNNNPAAAYPAPTFANLFGLFGLPPGA